VPRVLRVLVVATTLAIAVLVPGLSPARAATTTKVMVLGDSLSHGWGGDWTWRYWAWREARRQGASVDFVGPSRSVARWHGTRYERTTAWDSDHASVSGSTVDYHQPKVRDLMTSHLPDVLVVELGTNDLAKGDSAVTVASQLRTLITTAWSARPGLRVLLAELPNTGAAARDAASAQVNAAMAAWAVGRPVTVAHNRTGEGPGTLAWDPARFSFDGTHPNATGQTLYAHRFAQALRRMGVLPAAPSGVYRERIWSPDARPDVSAETRAVRVGWRTASSQVRVDRVKVVVDGRAATGWIAVSQSLGDTATVRVPTAAGVRRVQLILRRGTMTAAMSGGVFVTVP